jgi:tetratricopeptide (TPR) repeat protein
METPSHRNIEGITDINGMFVFRHVIAESATVTATMRGMEAHIDVPESRFGELIRLTLRPAPTSSASASMEFSDAPNFAVAGVTDWTAAGGHGSDATLRASESLANATAGLPNVSNAGATSADEVKLHAAIQNAGNQAQKAEVQMRVHAALQIHATANLFRLAGEADEAAGDSLAAAREFAHAADMQPSEDNEFEWGSELLLHRALFQAQEVFARGAEMYPASVRMQTALGTALFAEARYEEAAAQLCKASDTSPMEIDPYVFMGKVELASPNALPCIESHLKRYAESHPRDSGAQYLYAMAILKRLERTPDEQDRVQVESLLKEAVALNAKCSDGYLQLGVLAAQQQATFEAIGYYKKAIDADPKMADAYFRLAKAYARTGETEKARAAFATHDLLVKEQTIATERERKAVKQFLFVQPDGTPTTANP